ncbi:C6 zinc finger domain protein [Diplocarpon rosae]|nr:C6 zinc finger domain protein [Diplocarpon rosae]
MWSSPTQLQPDEPAPVKRFACDRCHDQKLRCTRPQDGEPCVRCQRAGVFCNVSVAQRTGRPRKSSNNRPPGGRKSTAGGTPSTTESGSEDGDKQSEIPRRNSTDSLSGASCKSMPRPETSVPINWDADAFTSGSSLEMAPSSLSLQPYDQPLSTDDYADLLDCITDQAYFDSMDLSDFSDSNYMPPLHESEPNPKKRKKSSPQRDGSVYTNHASMSPPLLEGLSARISSFPDMDMPTVTPAITTPSSEVSIPDLHQVLSVQNESPHSQTLSKLQSEIDACSERIMHQARRMSTAATSYTTESQKLPEALGILLSTAERFIELITCICQSFDHIIPSRSPPPSPWYQQPLEQHGGYFGSGKMFSSHSRSSSSTSLDPSLLASPDSRALSTSTFYTMLKCHVRLLTAYDATLDTMSSRLLELEHLDMQANSLTCALSIGSFVVPFGAIIETLLHLQVISHQLDRLKTALHVNLLQLQPQRPPPRPRSISSRLGLCRQGRNPSTKLLRIENLAESSKQGQSSGEFMNWA